MIAAIRVGDVGRALSPMSPSGAVEVQGQRVDARSELGVIEAGCPVVVLRGDPTGYVVRKLEPGQQPPQLPNHGEPIERAEFQRTHAQVAEADRREQAEARRRMLRALRYGSLAAAGLGAVVGLASAGAGLLFGWFGRAEPMAVALLLGGSLLVGAVTSVLLFFLTGLVGSVIGFASEGEAAFAPDFFAVFAALVGAAVGFWWQFRTEDVETIALWTAGVGVAFAAVAFILSWLANNVLESAAGA